MSELEKRVEKLEQGEPVYGPILNKEPVNTEALTVALLRKQLASVTRERDELKASVQRELHEGIAQDVTATTESRC